MQYRDEIGLYYVALLVGISIAVVVYRQLRNQPHGVKLLVLISAWVVGLGQWLLELNHLSATGSLGWSLLVIGALAGPIGVAAFKWWPHVRAARIAFWISACLLVLPALGSVVYAASGTRTTSREVSCGPGMRCELLEHVGGMVPDSLVVVEIYRQHGSLPWLEQRVAQVFVNDLPGTLAEFEVSCSGTGVTRRVRFKKGVETVREVDIAVQ